MQPLYDLSTVRQTLRDGILKGYWTLEDLDTPPPGFIGGNHINLLRPLQSEERPDAGPDPRDLAPSEPFDPLDI